MNTILCNLYTLLQSVAPRAKSRHFSKFTTSLHVNLIVLFKTPHFVTLLHLRKTVILIQIPNLHRISSSAQSVTPTMIWRKIHLLPSANTRLNEPKGPLIWTTRTGSQVAPKSHFRMISFIIWSWFTYSSICGACISIPIVPPIVTDRNMYNRSLSITLATYFQSSNT